MPTRQQYEKTSVAGGEVSPALQGATDLRGYQIGLAVQENMVTVLEGVVTRRPGTCFVQELKNQVQRGKLWPFRRTSNDYYMLVLNGGAMRVLRGGSFVVSGGGSYEMAIPWTEAQLAALRGAPAGNTITFAGGGRLQQITYVAANNWTIAEYLPQNGPIETENADKTVTVLPSATQGAVTLAGQNNPFNAGMLGGVMRIDEANANLTTAWTANEAISQPLFDVGPNSMFGDMANPGYLTDGVTTTVATKTDYTAYAGWHFNTPTTISAAVLISPNTGFTNYASGTPPELKLELWGKNGAPPANQYDGTLLGSTVIIDNKQAWFSVYSLDTESLWTDVWFRIVSTQGAFAYSIPAAAMRRRQPPLSPILRRYGENIYEAITDGSAGANPPTHTDGDAAYDGVVWRFRCKIYGFVRITAVTGPNAASGTVITRLPDSATLKPTYRWWPPSWSDGAGWPENIQGHQQRLIFTRKNRLWASQPTTTDNFLLTVDPDSAIALSVTPPDGQSLPEIQWMSSSGIVVLGTADIEWMLRAPGSNDILQASTIDPVPDSQEGSAPQIPAKVGRGVMFAGRGAKRLHYLKFDALTQQLAPEEVSAAARHIPMPGIVAMAWQKDPHKVLWIVLADGTLAGLTFMPDQKIAAMHRHPMINAFVEDIAAIPALDDGRVDIYMIVRRTIGGQVKRYVELLQPFFTAADPKCPTADGAWFLDCALRYSGAAVERVTGLDHLVGQTVGVFADGAMQAPKVVDVNGGITLDFPAADVVAGLPQTWRVKDLPRSLQIPGGTSRGKAQRATHVVIDVLETASGRVRLTYPRDDRNAPDDDTPFDVLIETGPDDYGAAIKLFTGQIPMTVTGPSGAAVVTELDGDDAMPVTLRAIVPDVIVEGE